MNLHEIATAVIKRNPDSCIAYNYHAGYCYEELVKELISYFAFEVLDLCGCGLPEWTYETIRRYLNIRSDWQEDRITYAEVQRRYAEELHINEDNVAQYGMLQFMMYTLDSAGITEHGGSVGGCWLTDLGKMFLTVLNAWAELESTKEEFYE